MSEMEIRRRPFILKTGVGLVAAFVSTLIGPADATAQEMKNQSGSDGYTMLTSVQGCGTCEFWGGQRRVSKDGKTITFTGPGWCNNAKSDHYLTLTRPNHVMGTWRKWSVLG